MLSKDDNSPKGGNFNWEDMLHKYRIPLSAFLVGMILIGAGFIFYKENIVSNQNIEIIESGDVEGESIGGKLVVEIAGAVEKPGVYKLESSARVEDLLIIAGGISVDADRVWVEKTINRAAKLVDGQKVFIKDINEQTQSASAKESGGDQSGSSVISTSDTRVININTASQKELESLWGIGPVYAQNIIDQRPYSTAEELLTKNVIKSNVYERNKNLLTVY
jgi:competence protein ComEA